MNPTIDKFIGKKVCVSHLHGRMTGVLEIYKVMKSRGSHIAFYSDEVKGFTVSTDGGSIYINL